MRFSLKILSVIVFVFILPVLLQAKYELPLHQKRLSDRVLIVWAGDIIQTTATVALATREGIVVIDTSIIPSQDARIRKVIEKEFGRDDFRYLINTHFHHDHTCGNQIYSDATVIGHKNTPAGMKAELTGEGLVKLVDKFKNMLKDQEEALQRVKPESKDYKFLKEFIIYLELAILELQKGFIPTYPSILFEKNMILDMGDMTVELYAIGGMHTDSDIVVFVPEEGLVALGDVFPEQVLPHLKKNLRADFSMTLENWARIVNSQSEIKYVNMAHSDWFLSVETFKEQYKYLNTLWQGLKEMCHQGLTLEDAKKKYTIEEDFPYFKDKIIKIGDFDLNKNNIEEIWKRIAK